jgi:hypothetical protein
MDSRVNVPVDSRKNKPVDSRRSQQEGTQMWDIDKINKELETLEQTRQAMLANYRSAHCNKHLDPDLQMMVDRNYQIIKRKQQILRYVLETVESGDSGE